MAQTLVSLMVHVIFSTKNREPFITPEIEPELFAYIGGILKNHESRLLDAGGTARSRSLAHIAIKEHCAQRVAKGREERQFLMDQDKGK